MSPSSTVSDTSVGNPASITVTDPWKTIETSEKLPKGPVEQQTILKGVESTILLTPNTPGTHGHAKSDFQFI